LFGVNAAGGLFGNAGSNATVGGLFGGGSGGGLLGASAGHERPLGGALFGINTGSGLFGNASNATTVEASFGSNLVRFPTDSVGQPDEMQVDAA
jgi:hypothetical protein